MILLHGDHNTIEAKAALEIKNLILSDHPWMEENDNTDVHIFSKFQCFGQRTKDIDILLLGNFLTFLIHSIRIPLKQRPII